MTGDGRPGLLAGLALRIRERRLLAADLVAESLARIERAADLNAVIAIRPEGALADARAIDAAIARGDDPGPLAGLPFLSKDNEDAAGLPTTFGSWMRGDPGPAPADGVIAGRLRAAGAILVGKTNIPEFAMEGYTANIRYGITRNPWARAWSPGGSSGGSAAALAAGLASIATATDVGGSIRIPAAACGLVGLKPSAGLIGRDPILTTLDLNNHGPLASTVADAELLLELMSGPVAGDPGALPRWNPVRDALPGRVFAATRFAPGPAFASGIVSLFETAVSGIATDLRLPVEAIAPECIFPSGYDPYDWFRIVGPEQAWDLGPETIERWSDRLDPSFVHSMQLARAVSMDEYLGARRRRFRYARELDMLLGDDAVLVLPTVPVEGVLAEGTLEGHPGPGLPWWVFSNTEPQNLAGHPTISLPAGRASNGVPFGLQVMAPRLREDLLFGFARAWEAARPWPLVADGYRPLG
jgi:Asp-tRNA(Asn)/Glu-tRNA(Gln) amidotransferase A subunit family amidase